MRSCMSLFFRSGAVGGGVEGEEGGGVRRAVLFFLPLFLILVPTQYLSRKTWL